LIAQSFRLFTFSLILVIGSAAFLGCSDQDNASQHSDEIGNRKSPIAIASVKANGTYVKVVYGQPYRQGRTIFGELLPWGEIWRTGANEATEITITESVLIGTESVRAGTYSLFTIPEPDSMTLILNYDLGMWGAEDYNPDRDYKRISFPIQQLENPVEAFSIEFSEPDYNSTNMTLTWGLVQVDVPIRFFGE
jgi:hypothetical protein